MESVFTIYSFDLYYHGESTRADTKMSSEEWHEDFQSFLLREKIDRFSIASFSLGGRFAIVSTILFANKIESLILVAPDGIYRSFWFNLATSKPGNPLFKYLMLHPERFNQILHFVETFGLAASQMIRFAQKELAVKENRKKVYRTWTYFKTLQPDLKKFKAIVNHRHIPVHLVLGSKDYIIPAKEVTQKLVGISALTTHILEVKHHQLIEASKTLIPSLLKGGNL